MKKIVFAFIAVAALTACSKVALTGRRQTKLLPESQLVAMAETQYRGFLSQNKLSTDAQKTALVKEVGGKIQAATEKYYAKIGRANELKGYKWEFNLVESPDVNAWCMPGGKVVVYTGILPITQDADGLAVVMGHEVAHALAYHGNERMSQGLVAQLGEVALSVALVNKSAQTQNLFMQAYGIGSQVGALLPFSRIQETEADEIGLRLMAIAGYNPYVAGDFWKRMNAGAGGRPPEFLSTHPDPAKRAENLKLQAPKAEAYALKYR